MDIAWEAKKKNLDRAEIFIGRASAEHCDIAVFPEMFSIGFSMNVSLTDEDVHGPTSRELSQLAKKFNINIIAGIPLKTSDAKKAENSAVVYDRQGRLTGRYSKMHPFCFAGEDHHYSAGSAPVVLNIDGMEAGIFICYDLRFPEVFRMIAKDVKAIFVIANWPSSRKEHWESLLKARAIENQCFVIGVNRTGKDGNGIDYPGGSRVYGPMGIEICAGNDKDEFIICEIDLPEVTETRSKFPFLKDMRSDTSHGSAPGRMTS